MPVWLCLYLPVVINVDAELAAPAVDGYGGYTQIDSDQSNEVSTSTVLCERAGHDFPDILPPLVFKDLLCVRLERWISCLSLILSGYAIKTIP